MKTGNKKHEAGESKKTEAKENAKKARKGYGGNPFAKARKNTKN
jgi:hypothetical protein